MNEFKEFKYKREYCCPECGLIWISESNICPECGNSLNYAVDTYRFYYAEQNIKEYLKSKNKSIHYAEDHPINNINLIGK